ncbi:MAG TPA: TIGR02996 domain-containing protein [Fimbriiglobus sp.]|nr:TIGR02996 domain-containing protein [Fimbriiglobus sp.]
MTTDETALLSAVEANADDDLPRLVFADWLEEHGHPIRAEFIRLQCEIAHLETDRRDDVRPHHYGLWQRQAELLAAHRGDALGPLAGLPGTVDVRFDRGFVSRVELRVADFLDHGAALDAARPRPRVRVIQVAADVIGIVTSPHLGCITEIGGYAPGEAYLLFPPGGYEPFMAAMAHRLTRLEVLDLEGCGIGDWFGDLFATFTLPALVELDLSNNHITDVGVADLLNCRLPRKLILGGNPITDQGAIELADRLRNSPVEYLNLRRTLIDQPGHAALLRTFNRAGKKVDLF